MTEQAPSDDRRLDLRALDTGATDHADAIVTAVMARIRTRGAQQEADVVRLVRARRYLLAAAAVLAAVATAAVSKTELRRATGEDVLAGWAASSHVPTNGDLLAAYRGYRP